VRWIDHLQRMRALSGGCVSCAASNVVWCMLRDARFAVTFVFVADACGAPEGRAGSPVRRC
jgi:hypothetical protein